MFRVQGHLFVAMLMAGVFASSIGAVAQSSLAQKSPPAQNTSPMRTQNPASAQESPAAHSSYKPSRFAKRAEIYYTGVWGVDSLGVKSVESGEMIRFTYRVINPTKASTLNDKKLNPFLIDEKAHVKLVVPQMEKVGQLRQTSSPEAGRVYWILFSNKGRFVKPGDRVRIEIGNFHANELVVD